VFVFIDVLLYRGECLVEEYFLFEERVCCEFVGAVYQPANRKPVTVA